MKLRAHHNVVDLEEARRERQRAAGPVTIHLVNFVGWSTQSAESPRPYFLAPPDRLTPYEIALRRQRAKETAAYCKRAFARLRAAPDSAWWRDE